MATNFASLIVKARRKLGLNQSGLAALLGVSQGSVSKWEAGKESPRAETLDRIRELAGGIEGEDSQTADGPLDDVRLTDVELVGHFADALTYSPSNIEERLTLKLALPAALSEFNLQAWQVRGQYPDLPRSFIGVFHADDDFNLINFRRSGPLYLQILMKTIGKDETVRYWIGTLHGTSHMINGEERSRYSVWPHELRTKDSSLPVRIGIDGKIADGTTSVAGVLLYVMHEPSIRSPLSSL